MWKFLALAWLLLWPGAAIALPPPAVVPVILSSCVPTKALNFNFTTGVLPAAITFTRASANGTYYNSSNVLSTAGSNAARFDYMAAGSTATLLYEPAATNLILQSNAFTTTWFATNSDVATAAAFTSPDGTSNGWSDTSGTGFGGRGQSIAFSNIQYTISVWAKNIVGTPPLNLKLNDVQSGNITISGTTTRYSGTLTPSAGTNNAVLQVDTTSGSTMGIFGAQLETGAVATSYIVTTAASATRAADVATFAIPPCVGHLTVTFDNNATQSLAVAPGLYTLTTTLTRPNIKTIVGAP